MNMSESEQSLSTYLMTTEGTTNAGLLVGGAAAALVSIIYSLKHIKKSSCWGVKCQQQVSDAINTPVIICPDGNLGKRMQTEV